jgi:hypothetical protein
MQSSLPDVLHSLFEAGIFLDDWFPDCLLHQMRAKVVNWDYKNKGSMSRGNKEE